MRREKFTVGEKGSIEENIERLQRELGEAFTTKGAPDIKEDSTGEKKEDKKTIAKEKPVKAPQREKESPKYVYKLQYDYHKTSEQQFNIFKSSKFYITFLGIMAFGIIVLKAPIFKYTTPFRPDNDLPQIEVGFRYYNNIFGKQTRTETVVNIGEEIIIVPLSMSRWVNMSKEKKLMVLKYHQK
jgi:hypothetical protein